MKRILSLVILAIIVSLCVHSFAQDNFSVTQNIIEVNKDLLEIDVVVPYFEGFKNADEINRLISNLVADSVGDANTTVKSFEELNKELVKDGQEPFKGTIALDMNYDYVKNGEILTVNINTYAYSGGAHGYTWIKNFTVNTSTGEIYTIKTLFKNEIEGIKLVNSLILDEIEKNPEMYFEDYEASIIARGGNYDFYIDGDKLVVYFGLYEIAPYAAGIRYFEMDTDQMKNLLKDEVYDSLKDATRRGNISYNGKDINSDSKIINKDYTYLLPLRKIAETLGHKVEWNRNDGSMVDGVPVSIEPRVVVDGITYVPLQYFKEVLKENVSLGDTRYEDPIIRIFSKENNDSNFYRLISEFNKPITNIEAANMYAEAVRLRNGAAQYGLLSNNLREKNYEDYKNWDFVTDSSSPWVDSYEISEIAENKYQIDFNYVTSVPKDSHTSSIIIEVIEDGQYWCIDSITKN